jgi:hypothetical protein
LRPVAAAAARSADEHTGTVEEFWVPGANVRADVVVVGGELCGYEIKSAADSLYRLPRQIEAFARIFDRCTAVVAERHEDQTASLLPEWWGLIVVGGDDSLPWLVMRRAAAPNPSVELASVVRLLWRDEAAAALIANGVQPAPRAGRSQLWRLLLACCDAPSLRRAVRTALRSRTDWSGHSGRQRLTLSVAAAR